MNNTHDQDIRGFMKGFVSGTGQFEDPTYLGFRLEFNFNPIARNAETNLTDDALFASPENTSVDSAMRYLNHLGYKNKASYLSEFKIRLESVSKQTPWFFQGIEGQKDLWSIPKGSDFNNFRGKDKVLTVKCLESIDMRMSAMAELYRQGTFDEVNMKWLLPENLRWFTCKLVIAEIRNFHKLKNIIQASATNSITASSSQSGDTGNEQLLEQVDPFISTIKFDLGRCEFDFEDSFFETVTNDDGAEEAGFSFKIKIGTIRQDSTYPVYGYRIYGNSILNKSVIQQDVLSTIPNSEFYTVNKVANQERGRQNAFGYTRLQSDKAMANGTLGGDTNVFEDTPDWKYPGKSGPPTYGTSDTPPLDTQVGGNVFEGQATTVNPILQGAQNRVNDLTNAIANAPANAIAGAVGSLTSVATAAVLGNVYDVTLAQSINSLVGQTNQIGNVFNNE